MHTRRRQCRHIFTDGRRCGSPALSAEHFCYYHHTSRGAVADRQALATRGLLPSLPSHADLTERSGIQYALAEVIHLIAAGDIDPRRAGLLVYALQTASLNLPKPSPDSRPEPRVTEIIHDEAHGPLAPEADLPPADESGNEKGPAQLLLEEMEREDAELERGDGKPERADEQRHHNLLHLHAEASEIGDLSPVDARLCDQSTQGEVPPPTPTRFHNHFPKPNPISEDHSAPDDHTQRNPRPHAPVLGPLRQRSRHRLPHPEPSVRRVPPRPHH